MNKLNPFAGITSKQLAQAAAQYGTPVYVYDESMIIARCRLARSMPNAFGLSVHYAMKANSGRALLRLIHAQGAGIDASSQNEAKRAHMAGIPYGDIILTTQEVAQGARRAELERMLDEGLIYNVCSLRQLYLIADYARAHDMPLSVRVHPGVGAGETATRNTGDEYSCFGVHRLDLPELTAFARENGLRFTQVHTHIGSGGNPAAWRDNIDIELSIIEEFFPDAASVSFGGGLKEARMPDEHAADVEALGLYAKARVEDFAKRTGRKLHMAIEPGTYIVANAGYAVTQVIDRKITKAEGFSFVILDGGMEINARPLLYGSRHPFYVIAPDGTLLSSDFDAGTPARSGVMRALVGRCCESGDSQSLTKNGEIAPRRIAEPEIGDYIAIGGCGAYCSSMSPFNYNSHTQIPEILAAPDGTLRLIRRAQTLEQIVENEI